MKSDAMETSKLKILGIETSCDETAAAVVTADRDILSNVVLSQFDAHRPYGGVVPEIAARAHLEHLDRIVAEALERAGVGFDDLDGIAATAGPGLIGGVMVGATHAKAMALAAGLPFMAVNHLEGHALTARLTDGIAFPYLLLLVSGGHCQLLSVTALGCYRKLGGTVDDAVGEAFDKTAKLLGLGYPGGPAVERYAALSENPQRFDLPRPMKGRANCDFSFAGLKTAVRQAAAGLARAPDGAILDRDRADLAAAFQDAVADVLGDRTRRAIALFSQMAPEGGALVVAGGVAANKRLRADLEDLAKAEDLPFCAPPIDLCTDNAAMIAWAGLERLQNGLMDGLDFKPRPRWPLSDLKAAE